MICDRWSVAFVRDPRVGRESSEGSIPRLCECGCGRLVSIATRSYPKWGHVVGLPVRFIRGHGHRSKGKNIWERIRARCVWDNGCFVWQGGKQGDGYGGIREDGQTLLVHRATYEWFKGPIPSGLQIDHVRARGCHSKACCNVAHLEPVTSRENTVRGVSKTHCLRGHDLAGDNLSKGAFRRGRKICRECLNARERAYYHTRKGDLERARKIADLLAQGARLRTEAILTVLRTGHSE